MRRPARLQAAVKWRAGYGGKNIVRGYARWFGVDLVCAMVELCILGVAVDAEYEQKVRRAIAARAEARARWRAATAKRAAKTNPPTSSGQTAGRLSGSVPTTPRKMPSPTSVPSEHHRPNGRMADIVSVHRPDADNSRW